MTDQPPETPHAERRRFPRAKVGIAIEFKPEGASVASHTETADLSLVGCYVEMAFTLPVGTKLDLVLWVQDHRLATKGLVVTHHPQFGNGIEFAELSPEDHGTLTEFLKNCETPPEANKPD